MKKRAKQIFDTAKEELDERGLWLESDRPALEAYAQSWASYEEVTRIIEKEGYIYEDKNKVERRHMLIPVQGNYLSRARDLAKSLGLLPEGRNKVKAEADGKQADILEMISKAG